MKQPLAFASRRARFAASPAVAADPAGDAVAARVERVLSRTPIIDGHNDLPWEIRESYDFWRKPLDLDADTSRLAPSAADRSAAAEARPCRRAILVGLDPDEH